MTELAVEWPRGEATACKAVYTGSNPVSTSASAPGGQRAISSVGERFLDTEEVTGSIPVSPTTSFLVRTPLLPRGAGRLAVSGRLPAKLPANAGRAARKEAVHRRAPDAGLDDRAELLAKLGLGHERAVWWPTSRKISSIEVMQPPSA